MPNNLWLIIGLGALIVAGIFAVFVPHKDKVMTLQGMRFMIVRWFHSAVWVVLAVSFLLRTATDEGIHGMADPVAAVGGILYFVYMVTLLRAMAEYVLALDASLEVLAINSDKVKSAHVEFRQADLFKWQPDRQYDLVLMSFWMSHVPPEKLEGFLETVKQATKVGGQVFMVDSLHDQSRTSSASNHADYDPESIYHTRKLNDGQKYTIVKVFYEGDALTAKLAEHGFTAQYYTSGDYFWWERGMRE